MDEIGQVVYLFRAVGTDLYKIGRTTDVIARKNQLQTGCPHVLELVGIIEGDAGRIEHEMHEMFAEFRRSGEWFEVVESTLLYRLFSPTHDRDDRALQFIIQNATDIRAFVEATTIYNNHSRAPVLRFEVKPMDTGFNHPFWDYYHSERMQLLHESPIVAVADFLDAFNIWPGRTEWMKKTGETYCVGRKVAEFACPRCKQPIELRK